ncbi:hypothetical protein ACA910_022319 [Epithemia clementina (nom. ined.)]
MKSEISRLSIFFLPVLTAAFTIAPRPHFRHAPVLMGTAMDAGEFSSFSLPNDTFDDAELARKRPIPKKEVSQAHKDGIFSPVVRLFKKVLGDDRLNEVRAKAIAYHSDTIKSFVSTADSRLGLVALKALFMVADKNKNGQIEEEELKDALLRLGFKWLKEKQVRGIFERAGGAEKGYLTFDEWIAEAPKTLKTNLVKLAKTNGGELGFLV